MLDWRCEWGRTSSWRLDLQAFSLLHHPLLEQQLNLPFHIPNAMQIIALPGYFVLGSMRQTRDDKEVYSNIAGQTK